MDSRQSWKKTLTDNGFGVFIAMLVFVAIVTVVAPFTTGGRFLTVTNILNIFRQQAHIGVICCAMTLIIITGNIDLSVGSMLTMLTVICANVTQKSPIGAIFSTLALGLVCGAVNGAFVAGLQLNAFIATLATGSIYGALTLIISSGHTLRATEPIFDFIGSGNIFGFLPCNILISAFVVVVFTFLLQRTVFGQRLLAIGANPKASRYSGIRSRLDIFLCYCLCGLCVGLSAIMLIARCVSANPQLTSGQEMDIVLAVVLGGTSILGGKGSIPGTVVGFLFIGFMSSGFIFLGLNQYLQWVIMGIILVGALAVDIASERGRKLWKSRRATP